MDASDLGCANRKRKVSAHGIWVEEFCGQHCVTVCVSCKNTENFSISSEGPVGWVGCSSTLIECFPSKAPNREDQMKSSSWLLWYNHVWAMRCPAGVGRMWSKVNNGIGLINHP